MSDEWSWPKLSPGDKYFIGGCEVGGDFVEPYPVYFVELRDGFPYFESPQWEYGPMSLRPEEFFETEQEAWQDYLDTLQCRLSEIAKLAGRAQKEKVKAEKHLRKIKEL